MAVRIGHASISEKGTITGNAGDNNGKEVCIRNWYQHSSGWVVLRCKNAAKREKIAEAMEKACKNDNIGYDQNQRDTLYNNVKDKGFDPSKTTKKVETDCSALVRVCVAYAYGKDIAGNIRTVSEPSMLVNTGEFTKYTSDKYCKSSDYLMRGDILCTPVSGHTVVVLDNGAKVENTSSGASTSAKKSIEEVAKEVIDGKWGNGSDRKKKLEAAGYNYEEVQVKVNELLKGGSSSEYYPKYTGNSYGIDTVFKAIGVPEKFCGNYKNRKPIATVNGISNYTGTASQNTKLITLAKEGKLKRP